MEYIKRKKGQPMPNGENSLPRSSKRSWLPPALGRGHQFQSQAPGCCSRGKSRKHAKGQHERAIKKDGELEGVNYEELTYEGYGPGGVAMMLEVLTDNKNRTVADVRHIFSKHNGSLVRMAAFLDV